MGLYYATNHVDVKNGLPLKRSWLEKIFERKNHIYLFIYFISVGVELLFFSPLYESCFHFWTLCWSEKAIKILILGFQEVTTLFVHRKTNDFPTSWNYILLLLASREGQSNWPVCPKVAPWGRCFKKCTDFKNALKSF